MTVEFTAVVAGIAENASAINRRVGTIGNPIRIVHAMPVSEDQTARWRYSTDCDDTTFDTEPESRDQTMHHMAKHRGIFFLFITSLALIATTFNSLSHAQEVFSVDATSGAPFAAGDILAPGPFLVIPDSAIASLGALTGAEIDGISDGGDFGPDLLFSVDSASIGAIGTDVFAEAIGGGLGPSDHPSDIYFNPLGGPGTNFIFRDGDGLANPLVAPGFGLAEPFAAASDNVDAYDFGRIGAPLFAGSIYFTVGAAAPAGLATDAIHVVPSPGGAISTYASGFTLSLTAADDIDAIFVLDDGDGAFSSGADFVGFSLDRGDPSLSAGSALSLLYAGGAPLSAADVFILTGTGGAFYVPAASHGLLFTDNIDALDQTFVIPEPSAIGLTCLAAIGLFVRRRRRPNVG